MKFGKTIKIFLIDGDPNGRMTCELSNWNGKAYKIPRIKIKDCTDRSDLTNTGIYLLFGRDDEGKELVYIGEAESIIKRLNTQIKDKEFWNETIIFIVNNIFCKGLCITKTNVYDNWEFCLWFCFMFY